MIKICGCPSRGRMAGITGIGRCQMGTGLAWHFRIVVAREASTGPLRMIKVCGCPSRGRMAGITGIGRCQMGTGLARCLGVVVTREARTGYSRMVEGNIGPACGDMAVLANIRRGQMVRRFADSRCVQLVVARETCAYCRGVVKLRRRLPDRKAGVAIFANI